MGSSSGKETCGRCSMSTVVDAVEERRDGDGDRYDPFEGGYIEVDERELRLANAPGVYAGRAKRWLDRTAERLIYGG